MTTAEIWESEALGPQSPHGGISNGSSVKPSKKQDHDTFCDASAWFRADSGLLRLQTSLSLPNVQKLLKQVMALIR